LKNFLAILSLVSLVLCGSCQEEEDSVNLLLGIWEIENSSVEVNGVSLDAFYNILAEELSKELGVPVSANLIESSFSIEELLPEGTTFEFRSDNMCVIQAQNETADSLQWQRLADDKLLLLSETDSITVDLLSLEQATIEMAVDIPLNDLEELPDEITATIPPVTSIKVLANLGRVE
jgi:hypothetical protein